MDAMELKDIEDVIEECTIPVAKCEDCYECCDSCANCIGTNNNGSYKCEYGITFDPSKEYKCVCYEREINEPLFGFREFELKEPSTGWEVPEYLNIQSDPKRRLAWI